MKRSFKIGNEKSSFWLELAITLLGICGVIFFLQFYERALPNASINLKLSREQISQETVTRLVKAGYAPEGYQNSLLFREDRTASYYLQRKLGIEESNRRLVSENWPLYYWSARWYKPQAVEEFFIDLSPLGELVSFQHTIKEDAPGAAIAQEQAQKIAESFLAVQTGWDATGWERVEASSEAQPGGRVDHSFGWKSRAFSAADAELRYSVMVQGDQVGSMRQWIKVPESFTRAFASERDLAGFISAGCLFVGMAGFFSLAFVGVLSLGEKSYRRAIPPALLAAGVSLAAYLNYLPLFSYSYDTTQDFNLFWIGIIFSIFSTSFFYLVQVLVAWAGGQFFSKLVWPRQDRILARGPERWLTFSRSAWRGLMLAGINLGYIVGFYLLTTRLFGWWTPASAEYSNIFGTPFPFLEAFQVGLDAALTEELLFRFVGITVLLWAFGNKRSWLAVLIPGALWAFAHSSYVTYPIYARGVELTIEAFLLGFVFLKFDLFTTIMSHFTFNMIVVAMPLLRSDVPYFRFSGLIVLCVLMLPLLPGLWVLLTKRLRKQPESLNSLELAPACQADLAQLAALPVRADWPVLMQDAQRVILCLRSRDELVGFATGFVGAGNVGEVDGVYVVPGWRRQYWGATLLDGLNQHFKSLDVLESRSLVLTAERRPFAFLNNQSWSTRARILAPLEAPTFGGVFRNVLGSLRDEWQEFRHASKMDASEAVELEIPRRKF